MGGQSYSVITDVLAPIFGHLKDSFGQAVKKSLNLTLVKIMEL